MADELFSVDDNYLFGSIKNNDRSIWLDKILKHKGDYKIKRKGYLWWRETYPLAQIYVMIYLKRNVF